MIVLLLMLFSLFVAGPILLGGGLQIPGLNAPAPAANPGGPGGVGASASAAPASASSTTLPSVLPASVPPVASSGPSVSQPSAGGQGTAVPPISERYFGSGSVQARVEGAMSVDANLEIDTIKSYVSNDGLAWIAYGAQQPGADEVLITFNEPEDTVTVAQGARFVKGLDDECRFDVTVTDALVSGHISCPAAEAYEGDQPIGQASIEVDFTAATES
jgi:hypothetical protein